MADISVRNLANIIPHHEGYNEQKAHLLSCSTGSTDDRSGIIKNINWAERGDCVTYFGFFRGMTYGNRNEDFDSYKKIINKLKKSDVLAYMNKLPIAAIAPVSTKDMFTGEYLEEAGLIEDGDFCFPIDFIHYYENYDIGIPVEYEEYLMNKI